jgi:hypothetical protein
MHNARTLRGDVARHYGVHAGRPNHARLEGIHIEVSKYKRIGMSGSRLGMTHGFSNLSNLERLARI